MLLLKKQVVKVSALMYEYQFYSYQFHYIMKMTNRKTTALSLIYMKLTVISDMEPLIFNMHNPQSHTNITVKISPVLTVVI